MPKKRSRPEIQVDAGVRIAAETTRIENRGINIDGDRGVSKVLTQENEVTQEGGVGNQNSRSGVTATVTATATVTVGVTGVATGAITMPPPI